MSVAADRFSYTARTSSYSAEMHPREAHPGWPEEVTDGRIDWATQDWDDLVPRLLLLARSRLSRMTWRSRRDGSPPGAAEAEDFVHDAIAKTIDGVRIWNREACTLFQHLAGVVVSDISHAATSAENRLTLRNKPDDESGADWIEQTPTQAPDQEQVTAWEAEQRRLFDHLATIDAKLARMAELMLTQDMHETTALSPAIGVEPKDIANMRKRLKRAVRAYLAETGS